MSRDPNGKTKQESQEPSAPASVPNRLGDPSAETDAIQQPYFNRELSLLAFNRRVLELAQDESIPLLERLRFLAISTSNLDEFFEIRVAGLKQQIQFEIGVSRPDRLRPETVFQLVSDEAHQLVADQYAALNHEILPALASEGIRILTELDWTPEQELWIDKYFDQRVQPVLTSIGLDPAHPFPRTINKSLNFVVAVKGKDAFGRMARFAVIQAPRVLPRLIELPPELATAPHEFVLLSTIIEHRVSALFPGMKIRGCYQFRVTRNSDLWVDEEEVEDLMKALQGELMARQFADAVRLEIDHDCPRDIERFLLAQFALAEVDSYRVEGPVNLHRLASLFELIDEPRLKFAPFVPATPVELQGGETIFETIKRGDVLLHHPYQSFLPVVELLREAASDPDVLAIKQT
ncbi:MAG: polyphosphate kinase, partial [Planctomycetes bacterium]|nr:polyphosphate kinase [Planctomycetota bacterium]